MSGQSREGACDALRVSGFGFRVSGSEVSGFGIRDSGFGIRDSGSEVSGSGFRGFGFRGSSSSLLLLSSLELSDTQVYEP